MLETLDDCDDDVSINKSKHDARTTHDYDLDKENHNETNAASAIANDGVATNASSSTSSIVNNNLDDDCIANSSRTT